MASVSNVTPIQNQEVMRSHACWLVFLALPPKNTAILWWFILAGDPLTDVTILVLLIALVLVVDFRRDGTLLVTRSSSRSRR
jgi:hypothetical protein